MEAPRLATAGNDREVFRVEKLDGCVLSELGRKLVETCIG
jgi:hypothetical protein